jgi:hypothetical protein
MNRHMRRVFVLGLIATVAFLFTGCDSDDADVYVERIYDDVGELDIELRERLAERNRGSTKADASDKQYARSKHPYQVGEMDLQDEELPRVRKVRKPRQAQVSKPVAVRRPRVNLRPVQPAPAPAPAPHYWAKSPSPKYTKHYHGNSVGEMDLEY